MTISVYQLTWIRSDLGLLAYASQESGIGTFTCPACSRFKPFSRVKIACIGHEHLSLQLSQWGWTSKMD